MELNIPSLAKDVESYIGGPARSVYIDEYLIGGKGWVDSNIRPLKKDKDGGLREVLLELSRLPNFSMISNINFEIIDSMGARRSPDFDLRKYVK